MSRTLAKILASLPIIIFMVGCRASTVDSEFAEAGSDNTAPETSAMSIALTEDDVYSGDLIATDSTSDSLTYSITTNPSNGTISLNASTGAFTYTPSANYNGSDSFAFTASDGVFTSEAATVSVTVNADEDAPELTTPANQNLYPGQNYNTFTVTGSPGGGTDESSQTLSFTTCTSDNADVTVTCNAFTGSSGDVDIAVDGEFTGTATITLAISDGSLTSSSVQFDVTPQYYENCKDMLDDGIVTADGYYAIDSDAAGAQDEYVVYCDQTNDSGGWTRIFRHEICNAGVMADDTEANETNIADPSNDKYSIWSRVSDFERSGVYEFKIDWTNDVANIWTQTSNPTAGSSVTGYTAVDIEQTVNAWGGLAISSSGSTYIDGSPGNGNWWYSVGTQTLYGGSQPTYSLSQCEVEVWVR